MFNLIGFIIIIDLIIIIKACTRPPHINCRWRKPSFDEDTWLALSTPMRPPLSQKGFGVL